MHALTRELQYGRPGRHPIFIPELAEATIVKRGVEDRVFGPSSPDRPHTELILDLPGPRVSRSCTNTVT